MASKELQKLLESIRAAGSFDGDLMTMRKMMSRAPAYPKPDDITWEPVDAAGVPAEWVIPDDCEPGRAVVYLHGGGYATGTLESAPRPVLATSLARRGPACSPSTTGSRRSTRSPRPSTTPSRRTASPSRPATHRRPSRSCGDSSGGGLALGTLVALRDLGEPLPGTAVCLSPWTDLTLSGDEPRRRTATRIRWSAPRPSASWPTPTSASVDRRSPTASPLFADLAGLPPLLVQVGSGELLLDDATRFAERARGGRRRRDARALGRRVPRVALVRRPAARGPGCHRPDRRLRRPAARRRRRRG